MRRNVLRYGLILSAILFFGSCTHSTQLIYSGAILGDSVRIYPLPFPVNTPGHDVFPTISRDWKWLYFGRRVSDTTWLYRTMIDSGHAPVISSAVERFLPNTATRVYFAAAGRNQYEFIVVGCNLGGTLGGCDLYELELDEEYDFKSKSNITAVNSETWESTPMMNQTGDQLWFTRGTDHPNSARFTWLGDPAPTQYDIMVSSRGPDGSGRPVSAGDSVNTTWNETSPSLGFNDSILCFTSDRLGGLGESDVYVSFRREDGTWGRPFNLGHPINTPFSESSVLLMPDNRHILISSDRPGEGVQGGSDIFVVELRFVPKAE